MSDQTVFASGVRIGVSKWGSADRSFGHDKVSVGRIAIKYQAQPWWASCPVCPTATGMKFADTHADAMQWANRHARMHVESVLVSVAARDDA